MILCRHNIRDLACIDSFCCDAFSDAMGGYGGGLDLVAFTFTVLVFVKQ